MTPPLSFLPSLDAPVRSASRFASISAAVVPFLRKPSTREDFAWRQQKEPLITLTLSSASFLNTLVNECHIKGPLYTVKTVGATTAIIRRDPWKGSCGAADLRWPMQAPARGTDNFVSEGTLLRMVDGHWVASETLLKPAGIFKYVYVDAIYIFLIHTFIQHTEILHPQFSSCAEMGISGCIISRESIP
jgi:hypothetical protein